MAGSMRRDLGTKHTKAIAEDLLLVEDGANMMIENGWLEQTPLADDRKSLLTKKEQQ